MNPEIARLQAALAASPLGGFEWSQNWHALQCAKAALAA